MKDPRPSLLERLLGRTVDFELPGSPGRRKVSKKWFDAMVAEGKIKPLTQDTESQLVSKAKRLVGAARVGPLGLFVPSLERFPRLLDAKPADWNLFLGVGSAYAGLVQHEVRDSSQERNRIVRRVVAEELLTWRPDALDALEDCEEFVTRSMEALLKGGEGAWQGALSKSVGVWVCWNLMRREIEEEEDCELASLAGAFALRIIEGCWDRSEEGSSEADA